MLEEEKKKKKKRQAPYNLAYVVSANTALAKKHYIYCIVDIVFTSIKCVWETVGIAIRFINSISTPAKSRLRHLIDCSLFSRTSSTAAFRW